jgi:voltage-gated potassium channel
MRRRQAPVVPRRIERILTSRHIFLSLIGTTFLLVILAGVLISIFDREDFPSVWLGIWWAIGTVTTVGYGDVVPVELAGRIVAAFVMVVGIAFLSLITATVASALVSQTEAREAGDDGDLAAVLGRIEQRLERLERELLPDR